MKKYDKYKDSGIEWIGEIPEHWNCKKLAYNTYMKGRIGWQGLKQEEFTEVGPFLITGMNFKNGVINWNEVYHITIARYEEAPEIQLKVGDVLMTKDGTIGKLLFVDKLPGPASLNSHLLVLRPTDKSYLPKYLYYQLQSPPFLSHIEVTKTGTTFFGITQQSVSQYKMIVPSIEEQNNIIDYLDKKTSEIDTLINQKQKLLDKLQLKRQAIINEVVTKGIKPNTEMKDSGIEWLGQIPKHWEVKPLKRICSFFYGESLKAEERIDAGEVDVYGSNGIVGKNNSSITQSPCIIIGRKGSYGKINYSEKECFPIDTTYFIDSDATEHDIRFLYYLLQTLELDSNSRDSAVPGLSREAAYNKICAIPPTIHEEIDIAKHLDFKSEEVNKISNLIKVQIKKLESYRQSLISEVVTGKVKVV